MSTKKLQFNREEKEILQAIEKFDPFYIEGNSRDCFQFPFSMIFFKF